VKGHNSLYPIIGKLYKFYFKDRIKQYIMYFAIICVSTIYASINSIVFKRNENSIIYESIAISVFLLIICTFLYVKYSNGEEYRNVVDERVILTRDNTVTWKTSELKNQSRIAISGNSQFIERTPMYSL